MIRLQGQELIENILVFFVHLFEIYTFIGYDTIIYIVGNIHLSEGDKLMSKELIRAVYYTRVSTNKEEQEQSFEAQEAY